MDELKVNDAIVQLNDSITHIKKATKLLDSTHAITVGEELLLGQKITLIYDALRELHRKIVEKRA